MTRRASEDTSREDSQPPTVGGQRSSPDQTFTPSEPFTIRKIAPPSLGRQPQPGRGRRSQTISVNQGGHYIRAVVPQGSVRDVAVDATLRAAALRKVQGSTGAGKQGGVKIVSPQPFHPPCPPAYSPH